MVLPKLLPFHGCPLNSEDTGFAGKLIWTRLLTGHFHLYALAVLRFGAWINIFMKPGDFEDICIIRILHFAQSAELLNGCTDGEHKRSETGEM